MGPGRPHCRGVPSWPYGHRSEPAVTGGAAGGDPEPCAVPPCSPRPPALLHASVPPTADRDPLYGAGPIAGGALGSGCWVGAVFTPHFMPPPPSPAAAATRRAAGTATRRRRTPSSSTGRGVPGGCGRGAPVLRAGGGGGRRLVSANEPRAARPPALRCWCGWHSAMGGAGGNPHRGHRPRVALSCSSSPVPHRSPDVGRGVPISSPPPRVPTSPRRGRWGRSLSARRFRCASHR